MNERPSFLKNEEIVEAVSGDSLSVLNQLVQRQLELQETVSYLEQQLKVAEESLKRVSMEEIPNLLKSKGLSRIKLSNGKVVEIKDDANVTIKDREAFFKWLAERKEDDIIKTMFAVDRVPSDLLKQIFEFFDKNDVPYSADRNVHPQTLKKFFKTLCGLDVEGEEREVGYITGKYVPVSSLPDWCSVFLLSKTKIK